MKYSVKSLNQIQIFLYKPLIFLLVLNSAILGNSQNDSRITKIESYLNALFKLDMAPGLAVGIIENGEVVYAKGFGYSNLENKRSVTKDTKFYIASTSKSFLSTVCVILDEQGVLDLDAPIKKYLPEFTLPIPLDESKVTLRELLKLTYGFSNDAIVLRCAYSGEIDNKKILELLKKSEPLKTGNDFVYSNLGYNLCALVIEKVTGKTWKVIEDELIFRPLKMNSTLSNIDAVKQMEFAQPYAHEPPGYTRLVYGKQNKNMHAAGGHVSSLSDLLIWLDANISNGYQKNSPIISSSVFKQTQAQQTRQDKRISGFKRFGWGLGWDIQTFGEDTIHSRNGSFSGFHSQVLFSKSKKIGVVILVNESDFGGMMAQLAAEYIFSAMFGKTALLEKFEKNLEKFPQKIQFEKDKIAARIKTVSSLSMIKKSDFKRYVGKYSNRDYGTIIVEVVENKLKIKYGATIGVVVSTESQDQFEASVFGSRSNIVFNFPENSPISNSLKVDGEIEFIKK